MTFVTTRGMGNGAFRDPIANRASRSRRFARGLGATSTSTQVVEGTTLLTSGVAAGSAIAAGAAFGSVVPVLGTAIGALVGLGVSLLGGNKETGGVNNPTYVAITNKWYNWLLGRSADSAGAIWWPGQMQADGIPNAWQNFSTSAEPVAAQAAQKAALYQQLGYGAPTDPPPPGTNPLVAPPTTMTYAEFIGQSAPATTQTAVQVLTNAGATPAQIAALTPAQQVAAAAQIAPAQASIVGGVSTTTLLVLGGGLLFGLLLTRNGSSRGSAN